MLNSFQLNTTQLNDYAVAVPSTLPTDDIRFNELGLHNAKVKMSVADHWDNPVRDFLTSAKPSRNGRLRISDRWDIKDIVLTGTLFTDSRSELDTLIEDIKKEIKNPLGNLDIKMGDGSYRRYVSTCIDAQFNRNRSYHIAWCPIIFTFQCLNPFGTDVGYSSSLFETELLSFTEDIEVQGNTSTSPIFIIVVDSATDIDKIKIANNTTGESIESEFTVSAGDVIVVDSENYSIKHNGATKDESGVYPEFNEGTNNFTIEFSKVGGGGSPTIDYSFTCKYYHSYL